MNIYTEFEKELLERLSAIDSRLESIERMLGVESKPEQKEPEWLPMKEAPQHDQEWIEVIDGDGKITKAYWIDRSNDIFNTTGWFDGRGMVFDPKGWKPLNTESVTQEPEWRPMELQKGNVIFTGGSKYVVRTPRSLEPTEKFICNRPHEDGDFSYLCGSDYCRCCSLLWRPL